MQAQIVVQFHRYFYPTQTLVFSSKPLTSTFVRRYTGCQFCNSVMKRLLVFGDSNELQCCATFCSRFRKLERDLSALSGGIFYCPIQCTKTRYCHDFASDCHDLFACSYPFRCQSISVLPVLVSRRLLLSTRYSRHLPVRGETALSDYSCLFLAATLLALRFRWHLLSFISAYCQPITTVVLILAFTFCSSTS